MPLVTKPLSFVLDNVKKCVNFFLDHVHNLSTGSFNVEFVLLAPDGKRATPLLD